MLEGGLPLLCGVLEIPYMGILTASVLLAQLLFSGTVGQRESFFRCRFHVAYVLYAVLAFALSAFCLLAEPVVWYAYFFVLIPPVGMTAVWEIWKLFAVKGQKAKKEKRKC